MMNVGEDRTAQSIEMFFGWYRQRRANAAALATLPAPAVPNRPPSFVVEQHVLVGSGLDALAIAWAETFRPDLVPLRFGGPRWNAFLTETANASGIFQRVAGPLLADHLAEREEAAHAAVIRDVIGDTDYSRQMGAVRFSEDDPEYDAFVRESRIVALNLPQRTVERFRFGEVLYREHRCHWVHRLYGSSNLADSNADDRNGWAEDYNHRVRYQNWGMRRSANGMFQADRRRPLFSMPWLFSVYDAALAAFEARCVGERRDPVLREDADD